MTPPAVFPIPPDWGIDDDHAVVVGISRYPMLNPLEGPESDARQFFNWVTDPHGGGVKHATLILSSHFPVPPDENRLRPTVEAIDDQLGERWSVGLARGRVGRRLYLYFAGHGISPVEDGLPSSEDAGLLTANAAAGRMYHVSGSSYAEYFRVARFFDEVVLFMDCCREHTARLRLNRPMWEPQVADNPGVGLYGFSTDWNRASHEGRWTEHGEVSGLFTHGLLKALRGASRREPDGSISSRALRDAVYTHMREAARKLAERAAHEAGQASDEATYEQDPAWKPMPPGAEQISFRCAAPVPEAPVADVVVDLVGPNVGKAVTLTDGALRLVAPRVQQPNRWEWRVATPNMCAVMLDGGSPQLLQITSPGESYHVTL